MSSINLLPWREARASRLQKQFGLWLGLCALATFAAALALNSLINHWQQQQRERNDLLSREIGQIDLKLGQLNQLKARRQALLDRMNLIEQLQQRRNLPVRLFNQLPTLVPNGVYLNKLALAGDGIEVTGKTEAYGRVANMMRHIDAASWLGESKISTIFSAQEQTPVALNEFAMTFKLQASAATAPSQPEAK
ncbi:MAG: PilN domain-containing protein [Aeromonas sp.]